MTKQEFLEGAEFRLPYPYSDEVYKYQGTINAPENGYIVRNKDGHGFLYYASIQLVGANCIDVFSSWMGKHVRVRLYYKRLLAEPAKDLAVPR
jgi:hypothetical protein